MLAVLTELFDGFTDVVECEMAFAFCEAGHDLGSPKIRKYLQCTDIEIAVVQIIMELRHVTVDEPAVLADAVATDRAGLRGNILRDEIQRALFGNRHRNALRFATGEQA